LDDVHNQIFLYELNEVPKILEADSTEVQDKIKQIETLIAEFKAQVRLAVYPVKCCCRKRVSCFCCFREIFGTLNQMRFMLEKNFDGRHFWIKSHDGSVKIDSMFFPSTNEQVVFGDETKPPGHKALYL
jgi:hypothetical protein